MNYYSLNRNSEKTSFRNAVIQGLAPDKGLYFPETVEPLDPTFIKDLENISNPEIAYMAIKQFVGDDIPEAELQNIVTETLSFDFPLEKVEDDIYALELFHGPTMAFKDVGARFMARCLGYFNRNRKQDAGKVTVLVATSGDTGGAVASGFLGVEGVDVVILYPSGKVSDIQERQLTTLGKNIRALEVDGTFDDCQDMVKTAFLDKSLGEKNLTSANSINVARWLPQMFYFFFAYKQLQHKEKDVIFAVPSGNFGNICAGIMAGKLGLPVDHFVAATNINDTVPQYLKNGTYSPKPSKQTISNAMDVGNPSNFVRIQQFFDQDIEALKAKFSSYSFSDDQTRKVMANIYTASGYVADPHGAVGYLGLKKYLGQNPGKTGIFLETAHPVKFLDIVEDTLGVQVEIPEQIRAVMDKEKIKRSISSYEELKRFLLDSK
ncbi:threonine synthase [Sinomicrobium oceani]|uniref:Threonine synthase n=1 Tax=Sinomicrobium oceani TaxID=1150368 RepID=A0A1K1PEZ6_9FLAO|nr:threonine synthase [Sinomicrobium oceani]SFW46159.1 threonine synthase [Sinomicrobium oceani]